jgi:hypothetical protein
MTAPVNDAMALFNLSVIINRITAKKHAKIIIILTIKVYFSMSY